MPRRSNRKLLIALPLLFLLAAALPIPGAPQSSSRPLVYLDDINPDLGEFALPDRKAEQLKTVNQFKVFYQFNFSDQVKESGITFRQQITEDGGRHYKAVHYDHGNGIAV